MTPRNFEDDLAFSHAQADAPWWHEVYRKAFPNMATLVDVRPDGWAQRGGIDRQIVLTDGTVIKVDEKVRREAYDDFALEYWSDVDRQTPGWICKDLTCDFIAYAFVPTQTCYLLPFQLLRRCFRENWPEWKLKYKPRTSHNETEGRKWTTKFIPVPIPVVLDAIRDCMVIKWDDPTAKAAS